MRDHCQQDSRAWASRNEGCLVEAFLHSDCMPASQLPVLFSCIVRLFLCTLWVGELAFRGLRDSFTGPREQGHTWFIHQSGSGAAIAFLHLAGFQCICIEWVKYFRSIPCWRPSEIYRMCSCDTNPGLPFPTPDFFYCTDQFHYGRDWVQK